MEKLGLIVCQVFAALIKKSLCQVKPISKQNFLKTFYDCGYLMIRLDKHLHLTKYSKDYDTFGCLQNEVNYPTRPQTL